MVREAGTNADEKTLLKRFNNTPVAYGELRVQEDKSAVASSQRRNQFMMADPSEIITPRKTVLY